MTKSWNHLSFVNISPTLIIDASMEKCSRALQHLDPKIWIFSKKVRNSNFDLYFERWRAEISLVSSIFVLHWQLIYQWKGFHEYYTMETQKLQKFPKKVRNSNFDLWRTCTYMMTSGMHRRPFEGRHLVNFNFLTFILSTYCAWSITFIVIMEFLTWKL